MAQKNASAAIAIQRLQQEIARDRLRLARRLELVPAVPQADPEPAAKVGHLHRIFTLMGEC